MADPRRRRADLTPDPRVPSVAGRCQTCAARTRGHPPPVLVVVGMEREGPAIYPVVRRSAVTAQRASLPGDDPGSTGGWSDVTRRQLAFVPLRRGERLRVRCPGCKVERTLKAATVLALANAARRDRTGEFLVP